MELLQYSFTLLLSTLLCLPEFENVLSAMVLHSRYLSNFLLAENTTHNGDDNEELASCP
jgi:hypothetical protein